jgi:hypothetical protein
MIDGNELVLMSLPHETSPVNFKPVTPKDTENHGERPS